MYDLFAQEYGWTIEHVRTQVRADDEMKLIHSILYRRGCKPTRKHIVEGKGKSFRDILAEIKQDKIDTAPALEGIIF